MRVVVTGASGCVGRAVVAELATAGHTVVCATRHRFAPAGTSHALLDLEARSDPGPIVDGADALVHLGARAHVVPRTRADHDLMARVNADGTRRLFEAASRAGVRQLLYASTVAVYGEGQGSEDDRPEPATFYGKTKFAGEAFARENGATALRLSLVFGRHDAGNVALLARQVARWGGVVLGDGANQKSLVYARHVAERVRALLDRDARERPGVAFNVVDSSPTQRELVGGIARALGKRQPPSMPLAPFLVAGEAIDVAQRALGRSPRWRRRVEKLVEPTVFDGSRLDGWLGYRPRLSLADALAETFARGEGA